jgi:ADP-heptose:LPS heptosyltransferase
MFIGIILKRITVSIAIVLNKISHILAERQRKKNLSSLPGKPTFLIINPQGYGDMIVMLPILDELKKKWEQCKIIVVASEKGKQMLKENTLCDKVFMYTEETKGYQTLLKDIKKEKIDVCIDTQIVMGNLKRWVFNYLTKSKIRVAFHRAGFVSFLPTNEVNYPSEHMVENYLALLKPLGIDKKSGKIMLPLTDKEKESAKKVMPKRDGKKQKKKTIIIHTCSENPNHRWQTDKWVSLGKRLTKEHHVLYTTPHKNKQYTEDIINKIKEGGAKDVKLIVPDNIKQLAALINEADLLITIDTSTVHIASATQTPSIIIYGPTITHFWGPLNKNQIALQKKVVCKGRCRDFDSTSILFSREKCQNFKDNCINYITEDEVCSNISKLLKEKRK